MLITIHCGGMPFNGKTVKNSSLGGSESAAYYLAKELAKTGHNKVQVFTNILEPSNTGKVRYLPMGQVSEQAPLGSDFHHYALNTPVDVMIIQRHPSAFKFPWASKINLLWLHDLANPGMVEGLNSQLVNISGILAVSDWHKKQIVEVLGVKPDIVMSVGNGVDVGTYLLHETEPDPLPDRGGKVGGLNLVYSSRPERGLENLVKPGGIMEQLAEKGNSSHLYVCNYLNVTPRFQGYYSYLYKQCELLDNVTLVGNLTKKDLAALQKKCDLCVYPTSFEETSCITAMECMAAGLPMLTSKVGALSETCLKSGTILLGVLPNDKHYRGMELRVNGKADVDAFTDSILRLSLPHNQGELKSLVHKQLGQRKSKDWSEVLKKFKVSVLDIKSASLTPTSIAKHLMRNSDIYALRHYLDFVYNPDNRVLRSIRQELLECYQFTQGGWSEHYQRYYEYESSRGVVYGPESLDGNLRFEHTSYLVSQLSEGSTILDYGCAHGHYTVNLAKRFPGLKFTGVDITQSNVDAATAWAKSEGLQNVSFCLGYVDEGTIKGDKVKYSTYDCIIAEEVLEHLESPGDCINTLTKFLKDTGSFILSTPYGPWEAQGYIEHWPFRAHVHHLGREDLRDLFGKHPKFSVVSVPSGRTKEGEVLGSYITTFNRPEGLSGKVDYFSKTGYPATRQTLSLCMILKDSEETLLKCLNSVSGVIDELIIGLDSTSTDSTPKIVKEYCTRHHIPYTIELIDSPLEQGFDAARNLTIAKSCCDWVLWLDADEVLTGGSNLLKGLRHNQYNGYAIAQHHFSLEPAALTKTDYPVRVFRTGKGIRFIGLVHEHPEQKLNEGVGFATILQGTEIGHYGYVDEETRQKRFKRNLGLLAQDREKNPERKLGKFLWLRDLYQMCVFDFKRGGGITDEVIHRAEQGIELFGEMLEEGNSTRMAIEALQFYSPLVQMLNTGTEYTLQFGEYKIEGYFYSEDHLRSLLSLLIHEKVKTHAHKKYS